MADGGGGSRVGEKGSCGDSGGSEDGACESGGGVKEEYRRGDEDAAGS